MLDIVASYHSIAIPRKTNETNLRNWQKKLILEPILARLVQGTVASYHSMQYQEKLMNQT